MRRIADLANYPDSLTIHCGCTRIKGTSIEWLTQRFGPEATLEIAEEKMRCQTCRERPKLFAGLTWGAHLSAMHNGVPEGLPAWVRR